MEKLLEEAMIMNEAPGGPQFNRDRHGGLYDWGSADSWYGRPPDPHWYPDGSYKGQKIIDLSREEIAEYMAGFNDNDEDPMMRKSDT